MNFFTLTCIWAFLLPFLIGIFVIAKGREKKDSILFGLTCIASSIWGLGAFKFSLATSDDTALFWIKIAHIGIILTPTFFFHYICQLTKYYKKILITSVYLFAIFFMGLNFLYKNFIYIHLVFNQFYFFFFDINKNPFYLIFYIIFYWIIVLFSFYILIIFFRSSTGIKRTQLKYFIIGCLIAWLGPIVMFLLVFGIPIYPYSNILVGVYPFVFAYAILRYRLMDINIVLKKTAVYSLSAGILTSFFVVIVISMTKLLSEMAGITSLTIMVIAAITIAMLFNPLKNRIQKIIDKIFYKKTYDYYATIRKVSHELTSMFDLKKIYNFIGDIIFSTLGLKNIYLLSVEPSGDYEVVYHMPYKKDEGRRVNAGNSGNNGGRIQETEYSEEDEKRDKKRLKIAQDCLMTKFLKTSENIVIKDELPGIIDLLGQETIDCIKIHLELFDGEVLVPVFVDDKLSFFIILGEKLSGDMFTNEDIKLLETISDQTAIAIKNANLYVEKVNSERLASMGMMSATFAHEVRNPLTSIKTFAQLMPERHNDPEFNSTFSKIVVNEIERVDGLIRDLLHFSSGKVLPSMDDIDITALIDEVLEYQKIKLELERRKISVEKIYRDVKINIMGDLKKLRQAFINIISNGCQAMGENGILKVNINPNGRNVDILISDTGEGISREDISRIFEPFYTTKSLGIGLGLAISKKIIEDHGGNIKVKSELSKGTTFVVSLPVNK
jgi:signal transduction histidine kinase